MEEFTFVGRWYGPLPFAGRLVSLISLLLLILFASIMAARAGLGSIHLQINSGRFIWTVVIYCAIGVTPSRCERLIWLPVVSAMFMLSVALS